MPKINEKDFIKELIFCIQQSDIVKAKALVQFFAEVNAKTQNRVLYELSKSPDEVAFPVLDYLCEIKSTHNRINRKTYDLLLEISYGNPRLIIDYLGREHTNQLTYIHIAGDLKMREAVPALAAILKRKSCPAIAGAVLQALGVIGSDESVPIIESLLNTDDVELKKAAIQALAEIGTPAAIDPLSSAICGDSQIDDVVVDGLSAIQSRPALDKMGALLQSEYTHIRTRVIEDLIAIGPKAVPSLVQSLGAMNTDGRIHALTVLGRIGDKTAAPAIQRILFQNPDHSNVRFAAYEALGQIRSPKTAISLAGGLTDPDEQVRLAAAKAIDNNLNHVLVAGLKNIIKSGDTDSRQVVAALIDSEADTIFTELMEWEDFPDMAAEYLAGQASPTAREHYIRFLSSKGKTDLAQKIQSSAKPAEAAPRKQIVAVDDSIMMLKLYSKKLNDMGYAATVYQHPAEALEAIRGKKPDLILTDLNMPEIDGLRLTQEIRKTFNSAELPIIMVTTQSDFVGGTVSTTGKPVTREAIQKFGVNQVLHKPFTEKDLSDVIRAMLP